MLLLDTEKIINITPVSKGLPDGYKNVENSELVTLEHSSELIVDQKIEDYVLTLTRYKFVHDRFV